MVDLAVDDSRSEGDVDHRRFTHYGAFMTKETLRGRSRALIVDLVVRLATRLRPDAGCRRPGERSILDDVSLRRPWNVAVKVARGYGRLRRRRLRPGVTIVIVNWNTRQLITDVILAIQRFSPDQTEILVCDNGSADGSRRQLRQTQGIRTLLLPGNAGHGAALDISMAFVRTGTVVCLDSDAIPMRHGWLDELLAPIESSSAVLSGTRSSRDFVHPVFMALDVRQFFERRLSFQIYLLPGVIGETAIWGVDAWDTAELMSLSLDPENLAFIEAPNLDIAEVPGGFVGDMVYHHGGVSRIANGSLSDSAVAEWRRACSTLGLNIGQIHHDSG